MTELRVAIVGCGIIGVNHARAIARHPELSVAAAVDGVPASARALADLVEKELEAARPAEFATLTEALAAGVDLVVICTPSGTHVQLAQEALLAGAHVLIEKPLDVSMARARRIAELAKDAAANGIVVTVISQHRFDPASVLVAGAAHGGRFGRLTSAVASVSWWRGQDYYDSGSWRGTWELDGGGAVMNQGVHTVDLLVWFLGSPVEVHAHTALLGHERIEVEDVAVATVRFASGALAVIHMSTAAYPGLSARIQVHGTEGSAIIDDDEITYFHGNDSAVPGNQLAAGSEGQQSDAFVVGHLRQYWDVVEAIRLGRPPGVRVEDALLSLAVVRAIYLSSTLHRSVRIEEVLDGTLDEIAVATG